MTLCEFSEQMIGWYSSGTEAGMQQLLAHMDPACVIFGPGGQNLYEKPTPFADDLPQVRARNREEGLHYSYEDFWCRELTLDERSRITYGGLRILCDSKALDRRQIIPARFTFGFQWKDGDWKILHIHFSAANTEQQTGESYPQAMAAQILEQKRRVEELKALAERDSLTGLLNLRALEELYAIRRDGTWLIELDLDNFKAVNDTWGHPAGNRVLQRTAEVLTGAVRSEDVVARTGGDEFVILLCQASTPDVEAVLERIRQRMRDAAEEEPCWTGISMGAVLANPGEALRSALDRADKALYQVKRSEKGSYHIQPTT